MEKLGFVVECADNGLTGIKMLTENKARADVVLMDLRMPVRSIVGVGGWVRRCLCVGEGGGEGAVMDLRMPVRSSVGVCVCVSVRLCVWW